MPHGFCVPKQRAERSRGLYSTDEVGAGGALAIDFSRRTVDFVSVETGLMPMDLSTSLAQSSGVGVQPVDSSVGCASVCITFVVLSSSISPFT